jgi:hypothetical protein
MTTKQDLEIIMTKYSKPSNKYEKRILEATIQDILNRLPDLVEIDEAKLKEIIRTHTTYFLGSSWEAMGEEVRNNLARGISHSKGIIRIREK